MRMKMVAVGGILAMGAVLCFSGCGKASKGLDAPEKTVVSFAVSPVKAKYTSGELVTVRMTKVGPESVTPLFNFSITGGSAGFPVVSGNEIIAHASTTSGAKITLTCLPNHSHIVNDVELIVTSGNTQFVIETE